ncbi:MAG TPA: hypothetical protein VGD80_12130, partial [Kofleriaceae bacterium]
SVPGAPSIARAEDRAAPLEPDAGALLLRGEITRILARTHLGATHSSETAVDLNAQAAAATERPTLELTPEQVGLTLDPNATFIELHVELADWVARLQIAHVLGASDPDRNPIAPALDPSPTSEPPHPEERAQ